MKISVLLLLIYVIAVTIIFIRFMYGFYKKGEFYTKYGTRISREESPRDFYFSMIFGALVSAFILYFVSMMIISILLADK